LRKTASVVLTILLLLPNAEAAIWSREGSVVVYAGKEKVVHGIACVFSENPVPTTYTVSFPGLERFVSRVEPSGFTVDRVPCGGGAEGRRCIAELCNSGSEYTRMITAYFKGPFGFSFKKFKLSLYGEMEDYRGSMKATGVVGAAVTSEPVSFIVHYYPYNGWIVVIFVAVAILLAIVKIYFRRMMNLLHQFYLS